MRATNSTARLGWRPLASIKPRYVLIMKLPFFDFNDSYPLTLGVSDDYFTLSTRLKRLGRAPMQPRRRAAWLLSAALLVSFGAVVPIEFRARAQVAQKTVQLSGIVKDQSGNAVGDATVYLMRKNSAEPLETATSDADGRFEFASAIANDRRVLVWADAGARGLGQSTISQNANGARVADLVILPLAPVKLLLVAPDGKRAANLRMSVGQIGPKPDEQWIVPRPIALGLQTSTNARGEAVFAGLPSGQFAQFWLSDQTFRPTTEGFGDLRGGQYAPIAPADAIEVGKAKGWKTIRLVAPVTLRGRVTTPAGVGKSGALVLARRIGADTKSSFGTEMSAQTRADANGAYAMDGLRPGFYRIEVADEAWLTQSYASPVQGRELKAPTNRVDLALSRGGLIRGVVRQKGTNLPVVGQNVGLFDQARNYQVTKTDARGAFQFRANIGDAFVWTQRGGGDGKMPTQIFSNKFSFTAFEAKTYRDTGSGFGVLSTMTGAKLTIAPKNYRPSDRDVEISASQLVFLPVKADATRQITIESAADPKPATQLPSKPITGVVIGPNGKAAANAAITIQNLGDSSATIWRAGVRADESGRFTIPPKYVAGGVRLLARANADASISTPRAHVATSGDNVILKLERDVAAAIEGQVVDEISGKPIAGVDVLCHSPANSASNSVTEKQTDAQGHFRFENLRPFEVSFLQISKGGYQEDGTQTFVLQKGQTRRLTIFMHPLSQTLGGRVLLADGKPAGAGLTLYASNQKTQTTSDGSFFFPAVLDEKFQVTIASRAQKQSWGPFWTRGARSGVTFQLTDARLDTTNNDKSRAQEALLRRSRVALVGRLAPPLRAMRWIVGEAPSFKGKVTLLHFVWMNGHSSALNDFARSFQNRGVQVVSIEQLRPYWEFDVPANREQYLVDRARDMGAAYPTAIDAPLAKRDGPVWLTGQSHRLYRGARYVVVGRDGEIKWVGGDGGQAIAKTIELAPIH